MDASAFLDPLKPYFEAFAEHDPVRRTELLTQSLTPDAEIWGPKRVFAGYAEISEKIEGFHKNWPGCRLVLTSGLNIFRNVARSGGAIVGADGSVLASGHAVMELAQDGRIRRVIAFWDPLPPLPESWPRQLSGPACEYRVRKESMFAGHLGAALAIGRTERRVNVGVFVAAAFLLDVVLWLFVLLGWESVFIPPNFADTHQPELLFLTAIASPPAFSGQGWRRRSGILAYSRRHAAKWRVGTLIAAAVFSHWLLDGPYTGSKCRWSTPARRMGSRPADHALDLPSRLRSPWSGTVLARCVPSCSRSPLASVRELSSGSTIAGLTSPRYLVNLAFAA